MGKPRLGIGVFVRGNVILMLTLSMSSQLGAQKITVVPDDISCPNCRITTERLFDLGGPGDTTNIVHTNYLPMDSRGRDYFQSQYFPGTIHVFGEHGKHIHSFGREGEGPGEFRSWAALFISPGDSLYAFDSGNYRLSVFSPEYEFVRSSRIDSRLRPNDGFFRADGSILVSAIGRTPETFGRTLHVVSPDGEVQQSFGEIGGSIVDEAGRLWVLSWVAADDWKSAFGRGGDRAARADLHDTIIEVLDPVQRMVLARIRLDEVAIRMAQGGKGQPGYTVAAVCLWGGTAIFRWDLIREGVTPRGISFAASCTLTGDPLLGSCSEPAIQSPHPSLPAPAAHRRLTLATCRVFNFEFPALT